MNLATKTHNFLLRSRRRAALIDLMRLVEQREIYPSADVWACLPAGADTRTLHTRDITDLIARGLIVNSWMQEHQSARPMLTEYGAACLAAATRSATKGS